MDENVDESAVSREYLIWVDGVFKNLKRKRPDATNEVNEAKGEVDLAFGDLQHMLNNANKRAREDELTKLKNRRAYDEDLFREADRAVHYGHPLSLIRFDVDKLKFVNDTYGHSAGDLVLVYMAEILEEKEHAADTPYRWGGDEFVILLPETPIDGAKKVAGRLHDLTASKIHEYKGHKFEPVTISQGIVTYLPKKGDVYKTVALELAENADAACYDAKNTGRNKICVYGESGI